MVFRESTANLLVFGCLGFGVVSNFFVVTSSDLLEYEAHNEYEGGSLGLFGYEIDGQDEIFAYDGNEDETFKNARTGAMGSLLVGTIWLILTAMHQFVKPIPYGCADDIFAILGASVQLGLAMVYAIWSNEICDVFGCTMGNGASWNGLAHFMYLAALYMTILRSEVDWQGWLSVGQVKTSSSRRRVNLNVIQ